MPHILIVEDDPGIALGLADDLQLEGYEVETVQDGETAIRRLGQDVFDLMILDVMLPGKDGYEVCRELRRGGNRIPIIMLTAKAREEERVVGLEIGADDYVTKPFSPLELRARIRALLRRISDNAATVSTFGDCELDVQRGELRCRGKPVHLTPLEFKLLVLFVSNRRRLLSRSQLLDTVWGADCYVTDRAVDTHISNLRRKINPCTGDRDLIVGVRGMGYRFDG